MVIGVWRLCDQATWNAPEAIDGTVIYIFKRFSVMLCEDLIIDDIKV